MSLLFEGESPLRPAIRPTLFPAFRSFLFLAVGCAATAVPGQLKAQANTQSAPVSTTQLAMTDALSALHPTLAQVSSTLASVDVHRWKAPGEVRDTTAADIQSILKDVSGTLPDLMNQAQAAPGAIAPGFAVFRNIDALYDVLLRITETATLAGSQQEANRLEEIRSDLQTRRGQLGNAILSSASAQDTSVVQLQNALQTARAEAAPAVPKKVVVNDGPDGAEARPVHRRKPVARPVPSSATPSSEAPPPQ